MQLMWVINLIGTTLLISGLSVAHAVTLPLEARSMTLQQQALHVANRLGYGLTPTQLETMTKVGLTTYLNQQLMPSRIVENPVLDRTLGALSTQSMTQVDLLNTYRRLSANTSTGDEPMMGSATLKREAQIAQKKWAQQILIEAQSARLATAVLSHRQLEAAMVEFWFNHFNVYARNGVGTVLLGLYDRDTIRPHALGKFKNLLMATAKSPAMLSYLNNQSSSRVFVSKQGKVFGINENYAREVMELHTLGVQGGYTQKDVTELSKILTGWSYDERLRHDTPPNQLFVFLSDRHDQQEKVFLGQVFKANGQAEGERALNLLAQHPKTARFIAFKLAQYFISDQPSKPLVDHLATVFLNSDGDLRAVMDALISAPDFWSTQSVGKKFKTPYQYVVSSVRMGGITPQYYSPMAKAMRQLNMPLYGYLTPDGYAQVRSAWLNPAAMAERINFATSLARGRIPFHTPFEQSKTPSAGAILASQPDIATLLNLMGPVLSTRTQQAIEQAPEQLKAALLISSPEFMSR